MNLLKSTYKILTILLFLGELAWGQDWANKNHYQDSNSQIRATTQTDSLIVFMGNSITESWEKLSPHYFTYKPHINRGISGQTTPQMLVRFRSDVINLKPSVVLILAGTNDIAGNTGPMSLAEILENIISMAELAQLNGIKVILCSVLPAYSFAWKAKLRPAEKIADLNELIQEYAKSRNHIYLDYYSSMVDDRKGLQKIFTDDGVHPNKAGYHIMETLANEALLKVALQK